MQALSKLGTFSKHELFMFSLGGWQGERVDVCLCEDFKHQKHFQHSYFTALFLLPRQVHGYKVKDLFVGVL